MDYIIIDKTSKIPLYIQISDSIRHHINLGHLKHGDHLPTESSICQIFDVSVIVAKKAYDDLVKKGVVKRIRGKGTYVDVFKPFRIDLSSHIFAYSDLLQSTKRTLISFSKVKYNAYASRVLKIGIDEEAYILKTVASHQHLTLFYQVSVLSAKYFPNLSKEYAQHFSIFDIMTKKYELPVKTFKQTFRPTNLTDSIAMILDMKKNDPAHVVTNQYIHENQEIIAFFIFHSNPDYVEFEVTVDGNPENHSH